LGGMKSEWTELLGFLLSCASGMPFRASKNGRRFSDFGILGFFGTHKYKYSTKYLNMSAAERR
jgi:hypothetical protein